MIFEGIIQPVPILRGLALSIHGAHCANGCSACETLFLLPGWVTEVL